MAKPAHTSENIWRWSKDDQKFQFHFALVFLDTGGDNVMTAGGYLRLCFP